MRSICKNIVWGILLFTVIFGGPIALHAQVKPFEIDEIVKNDEFKGDAQGDVKVVDRTEWQQEASVGVGIFKKTVVTKHVTYLVERENGSRFFISGLPGNLEAESFDKKISSNARSLGSQMTESERVKANKFFGDAYTHELKKQYPQVQAFIERDHRNGDDIFFLVEDKNGKKLVLYSEDGQYLPGADPTRNHLEIFDPSNPEDAKRFADKALETGNEEIANEIKEAFESAGNGDAAGFKSGISGTTISDGETTAGKDQTVLGQVGDALWGVLDKIIIGAVNIISGAMRAIGSAALFASGIFLNFVIDITIYGIDDYLGTPDGDAKTGVNIAWTAFRDIANMVFIFILLYISIGTILQVGNVNAKKMLANVIITAVLLNFSLFFTKIVIDVSNILALAFHDQITINGESTEGQSGLSNAIAEKLDVTKLYNTSDAQITKTTAGDVLKKFLVSLMLMVVMLIISFTFIVAGFLLFVRLIMLVIYAITSPIAFVSRITPIGSNFWKTWLNGLLGQSFVAPVYFMLMWVAFLVIDQMLSTTATGDASWQVFVLGSADGTEVSVEQQAAFLFNFFIIIGFVLMATWAAHKSAAFSGALGAQVGARMKKGALGVTGFGARRTLGTTAAINRATIGRGARALEGKLQGRDGIFSRNLRKAAGGVAGSSLDIRGASGVSKLLQKTGVTTGDATKGKGGFNAKVDRKTQARAAVADKMSEDNAKAYTTSGIASLTLGGREIKRALRKAQGEEKRNNENYNKKLGYKFDKKKRVIDEKAKDKLAYREKEKRDDIAILQRNYKKDQNNPLLGGKVLDARAKNIETAKAELESLREEIRDVKSQFKDKNLKTQSTKQIVKGLAAKKSDKKT